MPVSLLKRIIQEEIAILKEVEYDAEGNPLYAEPSEEAPTPDDAEVSVPGFAGMRIDQIKERLQTDLPRMAEDAIAGNFRKIGSSQLEILALFLKTLERHQALGD